jgi:uncharacterized protein YjdB
MRALRRARREAAVIMSFLAILSCRDTSGPTGVGRIAPATAGLAVAPVLDVVAPGDPVIPIRDARVRLFRLPGQTPELAILDTVVPFLETDGERTLTLDVVLTMANERFGMELALLDDRAQVVYLGRDTVVAYTSGQPPAAKPLRLRYAGPDTGVTRISVAPRDTIVAIGDALPLRVAAFLADGRAASARFGFAVHGTSAISVDGEGVIRATSPVPAGAAWVVARTATGVSDSVTIGAIVPARSITLSSESARIVVGRSATLTAVVRDSTGAAIAGREPVWSTSDASVATVIGGNVTAVGVGSATITARAERATAAMAVTVLPDGAVRVTIAPRLVAFRVGHGAKLSAEAWDALGDQLPSPVVSWRSLSPAVASVEASGVVRGLIDGHAEIVATVDGVSDSIFVSVLP